MSSGMALLIAIGILAAFPVLVVAINAVWDAIDDDDKEA